MILSIAFRNIFRQKRRSIITVLILVSGYLVMCWAMSMAEGSYNHIIDKFTQNFTGHIQIHKDGYLDSPSLYKSFDKKKFTKNWFDKKRAVKSYSFRLISSALLYHQERSVPAKVVGVEVEGEIKTTSLDKRVKRGKYWLPEHSSMKQILIGDGVAKSLKADLGDKVVLISGAYDGSIANDIFTVRGILPSDDETSRFVIYMPLPVAQNFYYMEDQVHQVSVHLSSFHQSEKVKRDMLENFSDKTFSFSTWKEVKKEFYMAMEADKKGNQVTFFIISFLVMFSVLNSLFMSVMERTREYGLMRALGASGSNIVFLIIWENLILYLVALFFSLLLGTLSNLWLVYYGISLSVPIDVAGMNFQSLFGEISFFTMGVPAILILVSVSLALVFPILKALSVEPQEAMRSY